jgi:hypothetical protein
MPTLLGQLQAHLKSSKDLTEVRNVEADAPLVERFAPRRNATEVWQPITLSVFTLASSGSAMSRSTRARRSRTLPSAALAGDHRLTVQGEAQQVRDRDQCHRHDEPANAVPGVRLQGQGGPTHVRRVKFYGPLDLAEQANGPFRLGRVSHGRMWVRR